MSTTRTGFTRLAVAGTMLLAGTFHGVAAHALSGRPQSAEDDLVRLGEELCDELARRQAG